MGGSGGMIWLLRGFGERGVVLLCLYESVRKHVAWRLGRRVAFAMVHFVRHLEHLGMSQFTCPASWLCL